MPPTLTNVFPVQLHLDGLTYELEFAVRGRPQTGLFSWSVLVRGLVPGQVNMASAGAYLPIGNDLVCGALAVTEVEPVQDCTLVCGELMVDHLALTEEAFTAWTSDWTRQREQGTRHLVATNSLSA